MRVLYVANEATFIERAKEFLERGGSITVDGATSVKTALNRLTTGRYNAVVSDCAMRDASGIDFLRAIRASGDTVPFILLMDADEWNVVAEAMSSGATSCLVKDRDPERRLADIAREISECGPRGEGDRYRELFDCLEIGVAVYGTTDRGRTFFYKDLNRAGERLDDVIRPNVIGRSVTEVFPEIEGSGLLDAFRRVWESGSPERYPATLYRDERISGWRRNDVYRSPSGDIISVFEDVTEQVAMERSRAAMLQIARETALTSDLQETYKSIHRILGELIPIDNIFIAIHDQAADEISFPYFIDLHDPKPEPRKAGRGVTEYVLRTGRPLLASAKDLGDMADRGELDIFGSLPVCWLGVPLQVKGRSIGVLALQSYDEKVRYTERDRDTLSFVSSQVAMAIERKNAERLLKESEEKYRTFVEKASDGIAIIQDGVVKYSNPKLLEMVRYDPAEIVGRSFTDFVCDEDVPKLLDRYMRRMRGEQVPSTYDAMVKAAGGECIHVELNTSVVDYEGRPADFVIVRDMTERIKVQEALALSERKYRTIFETTGTAMVMIEEDMTISLANEEFSRMTGYSKEEIEGRMRSVDFVSRGEMEMIQRYHRLKREGPMAAPQGYELKVRRKDGETRTVWITIDVLPETRQSIASLVDISEVKRLERELNVRAEEQNMLLDNIETMVWYAVDPETYGRANRARAEFLGKKREEIEGKKLWEFLPREEAETGITGNRHAFETKTPYRGLEWVTNWKGEKRLMSVTKVPKLDADGNVEFVVCSGHDVTELKHAEDALELANKKLALLGGVTRHDIMNQLTVISGALQMAQQIAPEGKLRKYLEMALNAGGSIEKYLEFSRDYERMGTVPPEWINVRGAIKRGVSTIELHDVRIEIEVGEGLMVYADKMLEKVFHNLIGNALKHGGERLSAVRLRHELRDGDLLLICEDDGVGIERERKRIVLEGKHGRGLYLVKEILGITGMTIEETGRFGEGARFEITVPVGWYRVSGSGGA